MQVAPLPEHRHTGEEATAAEMVLPGLHQAMQPIPQDHLAAAHPCDVPMVPQQEAVPIITGHPQPREEPCREQVLLLREAIMSRTDRFIQGPAPQPHKAGQLIPETPAVQHQDPRDHHLIAGQVLQDRPPTAGQVLQDRHLIADRAAVHLIQVAAGQADRQVLIPVAADRRVVVHPTQAAVAGQEAVQVQAAQEDNKLLPRLMPGR